MHWRDGLSCGRGLVARIGVRSAPAYLPVGTYDATFGSDVVIYAQANYAPAVRYQ